MKTVYEREFGEQNMFVYQCSKYSLFLSIGAAYTTRAK